MKLGVSTSELAPRRTSEGHAVSGCCPCCKDMYMYMYGNGLCSTLLVRGSQATTPGGIVCVGT